MLFSDLNLNAPLLNALDDMGLTTPTTIQEKVFPVMMAGRDICGIAQTGTGKTYAYLLPCLRQWKFTKEKYPTVLVVVPTRELVIQVVEEVKKLSAYMPYRVLGVFGGVNMKPQIEAVEEGVDMVVATPGRLMDLVYQGCLRLKSIKKLIIDEVDEMLNLGFRTQLNHIFEALPPKRQNLMFSATLTPDVEIFIEHYFNATERIEATPIGTPLVNIAQVAYEAPNFYTKVNLVKLLLNENETMKKVLIFVSTRAMADDLFEILLPAYPEVLGVMHSNKDQNFRFKTVARFHSGECTVLIATDIIARGLDIAGVSHVINFDVPEDSEDYIHRIGRTGRADKKGNSITFFTEKEKPSLDAIEELMKYKIPLLPLPEHLEISTELTEDEKPKGHLKEIKLKLPDLLDSNPAFHEKLAKNKKVNVKVKYSDKMKAKYKKPKKRPPKK